MRAVNSPYEDLAVLIVEKALDAVPVLQLSVEQHLYAMPVPLTKVFVGHVDEVAHVYAVTPNTLFA